MSGGALLSPRAALHSPPPPPPPPCNRLPPQGTPISRGLEDLYGLLFFLGAGPWDDRRWWAAALQVRDRGGTPGT